MLGDATIVVTEYRRNDALSPWVGKVIGRQGLTAVYREQLTESSVPTYYDAWGNQLIFIEVSVDFHAYGHEEG
jgi:hypothetical protein